MSYAVSDWAWEQECAPPTDNKIAACSMKSVLVCLATYANREGEQAHPSVATICRKTQMDERTVRKALAALVATGMLTRHDRQAGNGRRLSTEYRLMLREPTPANMQEAPVHDFWSTPANMQEADPPIFATVTPANMGENPVLEPSKEEEEHSLRSCEPIASVATIDVRKQLFSEGKDIIRRTTGRLNGVAGGLITKLLKEAGQDCGVVLACLRAAEQEGVPSDGIVPWVLNGIRARCRDPMQRDPSKLSGAALASYRIRQEREALAAAERANHREALA
jgi:hypothetical protein